MNAKFLLSNDYLTQITIAQRLTLKIQYSLLRKVNIKGSNFEPVSPQLLSIITNKYIIRTDFYGGVCPYYFYATSPSGFITPCMLSMYFALMVSVLNLFFKKYKKITLLQFHTTLPMHHQYPNMYLHTPNLIDNQIANNHIFALFLVLVE